MTKNKIHIKLTNEQAITLSITGALEINKKKYLRKKRCKNLFEAESNKKDFEIIVQANNRFLLLTPYSSKL